MKTKLLCILLSLILVIYSPVTAVAAEIGNDDYSLSTVHNVKGVFELYREMPGNKSGISTRDIFIGDGGTCQLEYLSSAPQELFWSVSPTTDDYFSFSGYVTIYKSNNGSYVGSAVISGVGFNMVYGTIDLLPMNLRKGTQYRATIDGVATSDDGMFYAVSSNAEMRFTYI